MKSAKWFERKFDFSGRENTFPSIIQRLQDTPGKLERLCRPVPGKWLEIKVDNTWSIKENIGHLTDLEPLWQGRLEDIRNGEKELRAADLTNRKTDEAHHNAMTLDDLLHHFKQARMQTITIIGELDEDMTFRSALHPRLKTPMRTMDHFLFVPSMMITI